MPREDIIRIYFRGREFKVGLYGNSKIKPPKIREIDIDNAPPERISEVLTYIMGREITSFELEGRKLRGEEATIALIRLKEIIEKYITKYIREKLDEKVAENLGLL